MTGEAAPEEEGSFDLLFDVFQAEPEIPWSIRISLILLGLVTGVALRLLADPAWVPIGDLGVLLVVASGLVPSLWFVRAGVALIGIASTGISLATHASLGALTVLVLLGIPFLTLILLAARLDPHAPPRPQPSRDIAEHMAPRFALLLALAILPALLPPIWGTLDTELAPLASVLILAGASLAFLGTELADRERGPQTLQAAPIDTSLGAHNEEARHGNA